MVLVLREQNSSKSHTLCHDSLEQKKSKNVDIKKNVGVFVEKVLRKIEKM